MQAHPLSDLAIKQETPAKQRHPRAEGSGVPCPRGPPGRVPRAAGRSHTPVVSHPEPAVQITSRNDTYYEHTHRLHF